MPLANLADTRQRLRHSGRGIAMDRRERLRPVLDNCRLDLLQAGRLTLRNAQRADLPPIRCPISDSSSPNRPA